MFVLLHHFNNVANNKRMIYIFAVKEKKERKGKKNRSEMIERLLLHGSNKSQQTHFERSPLFLSVYFVDWNEALSVIINNSRLLIRNRVLACLRYDWK